MDTLEKLNETLITPLSSEDLECMRLFIKSCITEQRAESDLVLDAVNDVAARQIDRTINLALSSVMHAAGLRSVTVRPDAVPAILTSHRLDAAVNENGTITYTLVDLEGD